MKKLLLGSMIVAVGFVSLPSYASTTAPQVVNSTSGNVTFKGTIAVPTINYMFKPGDNSNGTKADLKTTNTETRILTGQGGIVDFSTANPSNNYLSTFSIVPINETLATEVFGHKITPTITWIKTTTAITPNSTDFRLHNVLKGSPAANADIIAKGTYIPSTYSWNYKVTLVGENNSPVVGGTVQAQAQYRVTYS